MLDGTGKGKGRESLCEGLEDSTAHKTVLPASQAEWH
jgi:hypothetical protein